MVRPDFKLRILARLHLVLGLLLFLLPVTGHTQMQRVLGIDAAGGTQPIPAFSVAVPQGWQSKGGIVWNVNDPCNRYGYDFSWAALSPDNKYGVAILPSVRWTGQNMSGYQTCPVMNLTSARDVISAMVSRIMPQAQMLDYRQRPDFVREVGLRPGHTNLAAGAWMKTHVDAGEALFGFAGDTGIPMRMSIGLVVTLHETFMSGQGITADMRFVQGESLPAWLAFAPDGELNMSFAEQMRGSIQINPAWQRTILQHRAKINNDNTRTSRNIADINRKTNSYISRLSREGHENRMRAMDRSSEAFSNMMLERENWRDTDGTRLNAPMGGENMWRLDNGEYVSTDDHNFNPLQSTGQFGTQLERWE